MDDKLWINRAKNRDQEISNSLRREFGKLRIRNRYLLPSSTIMFDHAPLTVNLRAHKQLTMSVLQRLATSRPRMMLGHTTTCLRQGRHSLRMLASGRSVVTTSSAYYTLPLHSAQHQTILSTVHRRPSQQPLRRCFQSESAYHDIADETLESIQDAFDELFEENPQPNQEVEASLASGVLTIALPPHGTWVLNKQTPNQQIWWSSPLSGPRRYEYNDGEWVFTREEAQTLGQSLKEEIQQLYQLDLELEDVK